MEITCFFALLYMMNYVHGHGSMWLPPARGEGTNAQPVNYGGCVSGACMWFNQGCSIGCACNEDNKGIHFFSSLCTTSQKPTLDDKYRTFNIYNNDTVPFGVPQDWTKWHPWRAPGTAYPLNPCGLAGGSTKNNDVAGGYGNQTVAGVQGYPGTKLPPVDYQTSWKVGSVVDVAWGISANHGGGYQYRLCPKGANLTEECFMKTPLDFVGDKQTLRWTNGDEIEVDATRVSEGVLPKGSTWTKIPIPACNGISAGFQNKDHVCDKLGPAFPPPKGCNDTCWGYQPCFPGEFPDQDCPGPIKTLEIPGIVDQVQIPKDLQPGNYVVGFRWDCEQTPQVWQSCGDVTITV